MVTIQVGRVWMNEQGDFKPMRGRQLPILIKEMSNYFDIKSEAMNKHAANFQDFCRLEPHKLLYPDFKEIICIPGSIEDFQLNKYKSYLGKPYSQILFYLCADTNFDDNNSNNLEQLERNREEEKENIEPFFAELSNDLPDPVLMDDNNDDDSPVHSIQNENEEPTNAYLNCSTTNQATSSSTTSTTELPALNNSLPAQLPDSTPTLPTDNLLSNSNLKEKLNFIQSVIGNNSSTFNLEIRRKRVWLDTVQKLKRAFKGGVRPFTVTFVGEDAKGAGGPLKEYFTVLFEDAKKYIMCTGGGGNFTFVHDIEKLKNGDFLLLGTLIALAIINGFAGPRYLIPAVAAKMFYRSMENSLNVGDIPDLEIQTKVKNILDSKSPEELQSCLADFPERFDAVLKRNLKFEDKETFVQNICEHFCTSRCSEEILEVARGMDVLGLHAILVDHFDEIFFEFCFGEKSKPTAEDVNSMFSLVAYTEEEDTDPESVNIRRREEDMFYNLTNFIEALEEDLKIETIEIDNEVEITTVKKISLADFVQFLTGTKYVLPSMKNKFVINFIVPRNCSSGQRIVARTCTLKLDFPMVKR